MSDELEKLYRENPHLRGKSKAELERQKGAHEAVLYHIQREERRIEAKALVDRLNAAQAQIMEGLKLLNDHGFLADEVKAAHSTKEGTFAPHLKYKAIDAERVLNKLDAEKTEAKQVKTRKPRVKKI